MQQQVTLDVALYRDLVLLTVSINLTRLTKSWLVNSMQLRLYLVVQKQVKKALHGLETSLMKLVKITEAKVSHISE